MDDKAIETAARAIAHEFLTVEYADLSEADYVEDFNRNHDMYRRMAMAAAAVFSAAL